MLSYPVVHADVTLLSLRAKYGTSRAMVSAAVSYAIRSALRGAATVLMEPLMLVTVSEY